MMSTVNACSITAIVKKLNVVETENPWKTFAWDIVRGGNGFTDSAT